MMRVEQALSKINPNFFSNKFYHKRGGIFIANQPSLFMKEWISRGFNSRKTSKLANLTGIKDTLFLFIGHIIELPSLYH